MEGAKPHSTWVETYLLTPGEWEKSQAAFASVLLRLANVEEEVKDLRWELSSQSHLPEKYSLAWDERGT